MALERGKLSNVVNSRSRCDRGYSIIVGNIRVTQVYIKFTLLSRLLVSTLFDVDIPADSSTILLEPDIRFT